jgi:hypothetical protein
MDYFPPYAMLAKSRIAVTTSSRRGVRKRGILSGPHSIGAVLGRWVSLPHPQTNLPHPTSPEDAMAKGQMRSNKEKKKPKA